MLDILVTNAKLALAAAAGAALVAGGSAVAITTVGDEAPVAPATSARRDVPHISETGAANRSATATAGITPPAPKPAKADEPKTEQPQTKSTDSHGACVSAAVHAAQAATAPGKARGAAVSAAAKTCPKPADAADDETDVTAPSDDAAETETDGPDEHAATGQQKKKAEHAPAKGSSGKGKHGKS